MYIYMYAIKSPLYPIVPDIAAFVQDEHLEAQRFLATLQGKVQLVQLMRFRALEALRSRDAHDGREGPETFLLG